MSTLLKPWTKAAFELIVHAELHLRDGGDFDRRMAHIGFDNAIEVAITTYLGLNPIMRGNKTYTREDVSRWMSNYHTKLEFLQTEAQDRGWNLKIPNDEVAFYHGIRNDQYHTGGHGVPESDHLVALRVAALDTFSMLFGVTDIEEVLSDHVQQRLAKGDDKPSKNPTVDKLLDIDDDPVMIAGQPYSVSEALYATDPSAYAAMVDAMTESRNMLDELCSKYENCVRPTVSHIGFVHYDQDVYLKVVDANGQVDLTDTSFISGSDPGNLLFSQTRSPDENADLLVREFDPYSIINCFDIFTAEAEMLELLPQPEQKGGALVD